MGRDPLEGCTGFEWDDGNVDKNWNRHRVAFWEAEEVFFNEPLVVKPDATHSAAEKRHLALGRTEAGRRLFVVFTVRGGLIRVVSARDMTRREEHAYERTKE